MNLFSFNEVKVTYTRKQVGPTITSSRDAFDLLVNDWPDIDYCESFMVMLLSRGNNVLGVCRISFGSVAGTVADPKKIFQTALAANASAIILAHNHPSGLIRPSANDNMVTTKCVEAGKFLDLPVLDHIIVTRDKYFSYGDEGHL
jgi:DNA repair protein RadC